MKRKNLYFLILLIFVLLIQKNETTAKYRILKIIMTNKSNEQKNKPVNKFLDKVLHPSRYQRSRSKSEKLERIRNHSLSISPLVNDSTWDHIKDKDNENSSDPFVSFNKTLKPTLSSETLINVDEEDTTKKTKPKSNETNDTNLKLESQSSYISFQDLLNNKKE